MKRFKIGLVLILIVILSGQALAVRVEYDSAYQILTYQNKAIKVASLYGYLPLRQVVEKLGGRVYWYAEEREVCIVLDQTKLYINLRDGIVMRNGVTLNVDQLVVEKGHLYVHHNNLLRLLGSEV